MRKKQEEDEDNLPNTFLPAGRRSKNVRIGRDKAIVIRNGSWDQENEGGREGREEDPEHFVLQPMGRKYLWKTSLHALCQPQGR